MRLKNYVDDVFWWSLVRKRTADWHESVCLDSTSTLLVDVWHGSWRRTFCFDHCKSRWRQRDTVGHRYHEFFEFFYSLYRSFVIPGFRDVWSQEIEVKIYGGNFVMGFVTLGFYGIVWDLRIWCTFLTFFQHFYWICMCKTDRMDEGVLSIIIIIINLSFIKRILQNNM